MQSMYRMVLALLFILPAAAQAQTLAELRTSQTKLTSEQEQLIADWLAQRVPMMADKQKLSQAIEARSDIVAQTDQATPAFLAAYAPALSNTVKTELRRQNDNDLLAFNSALCLAQLHQPQTSSLLEELLKHKSAAARYWAVKGLAGLLSSSDDSADHTRIVQSLSTAGAKESSGIVLGRIYAGLPPTVPEPCLAALLKIMDVRLKAYQSAKTSDSHAELQAIATAARLWPQLKQDQQDALADRLGKLMAFSALRYTRDYAELPPHLRMDLARLVISSESLLVSIAKARKTDLPTPLAAALRSQADDRLERVSSALDAWAATAGADKFHLQTFNAKPVKPLQ